MTLLHRICLVLCVAVLAAVSPGATAAQGDGVQARLANPAVLRGEFAQEKQLKGFRNPLKSNGEFLLLRDRGVLWNTKAPFASSTRLTRKKLLATLPDGSTQVLLDADTSPGMAAVNALMLAMMAGDLKALGKRFVIAETLHKDRSWSLQLTPREAGLKRAFQRITLQGDRYVRSVEISEAGGDTTRIRFSALKETPPATSSEVRLLD